MLADLKPGDQMNLDVMVNSFEIKFSERVKNNYFLTMNNPHQYTIQQSQIKTNP